jgi:hypothetical protein
MAAQATPDGASIPPAGGSAAADRIMPAERPGTDSVGTWEAHKANLPDGNCPVYGNGVSCVEHR